MCAVRLLDTAKTLRSITYEIDNAVANLVRSLSDVTALSSEQRRALIARYTIVLEGNFIAWMTATHLAVKSPRAKAIIYENLGEELSENHPGMLRKFALASHSLPCLEDQMAMAVTLERMRHFVAQLNGTKLLVAMYFFEKSIAAFMPYLAATARLQGSREFEYTDIHGAVDVVHSAQLREALHAEMQTIQSQCSDSELLTGMHLLLDLYYEITDHHC